MSGKKPDGDDVSAKVGLDRGTTFRHLAFLTPLLLVYAIVVLGVDQEPGDEGSYLQLAENLTNGFYSGRGENVDVWFGPGLPLLLVPFAALDVPLEATRLLGAALLFAAVVVFYFALRLTTSPRTALIGAFALGLYLPTLPLLPTLHGELLAVLLSASFVLTFTHYVRDGRTSMLVSAAACLALLAVTRVVFGWVLVAVLLCALVVLLVRRGDAVKQTALVAAIGLLLAAPWLAYTNIVTGKVFYWSTSGGSSLYWMSSPYPGEHGDWHSAEEVAADDRLAHHRAVHEPLRGLNQVEFDEELRNEALRTIRAHPAEYIENVAANVSRMWFSTPFSYTPQKLSSTFYIVPNALLLAGLLAAVAWVLLGRAPPEAFGFALLLILGLAVQSLVAAYTRMLVPLVPFALWFIVLAASDLRFNGGVRRQEQGDAAAPTQPAPDGR